VYGCLVVMHTYLYYFRFPLAGCLNKNFVRHYELKCSCRSVSHSVSYRENDADDKK